MEIIREKCSPNDKVWKAYEIWFEANQLREKIRRKLYYNLKISKIFARVYDK